MKLTKNLGNVIRTKRKKMGLTQEELADKIGVHYTFIGQVERGEVNLSLKTLEKVVNVLHLEPNYVFKVSEDIEPYNEQEIEIQKITKDLKKFSTEEIKIVKRLVADLLKVKQRNNS